MMVQHRQFTDTEQVEIEDGIERVFAFVQDVVDDPAVLDDLPEQATITLTPLPEKDPSESYVTETRRFAVSVDPSSSTHLRTQST